MNEEGEVGGGEPVALLQRRRAVADVVGAVDATDDVRLTTATDAAELRHDERLRVAAAAAVREAVDRQTDRRVDRRRVVRTVRVVPLHVPHASRADRLPQRDRATRGF